MTPLLTVSLLAGALLSRSDLAINALPRVDVRAIDFRSMAWLDARQDVPRDVIYFDASPRPYEAVMWR